MEILALIICFLVALIATPYIKKLAFRIGATDAPNGRKVHQEAMARIGGLAIYFAFLVGLVILQPESSYLLPMLIAGTIIILTGFMDDVKELSPKVKLLGQLAAAVVVIAGGVRIDFINLPFETQMQLGWLSIPLTLLWIIGITNAINLIDGLDGLAAGVSSIVLVTIASLAALQGNIFIVGMALILLGSTLGFLWHNFHPAKIFMGDTGSLFLGFMIAVISLLGFKNVTLFSLVVPVMVLAVPISDTFYAIVRRLVNNKPLSAPDKSHMHHCLLRIGYSHRQTVLLIYAMSALFGLAAVAFTLSTLWVALLVLTTVIIATELLAERIGLVNEEFRPVGKFLDRFNGTKRT
ncbi:MraY family glycosyltransferase [Salsuginibacillus halophilus]|uniref:glycosyltransferase family 4 protein n=1 Tax=Salsuginibacillus halophilus TaxID=517424 RepID=UPI000D0CF645